MAVPCTDSIRKLPGSGNLELYSLRSNKLELKAFEMTSVKGGVFYF